MKTFLMQEEMTLGKNPTALVRKHATSNFVQKLVLSSAQKHGPLSFPLFGKLVAATKVQSFRKNVPCEETTKFVENRSKIDQIGKSASDYSFPVGEC